MASATKDKAPKGPPQELISRIMHLHNLLCNLPESLPENPPHSLYNFHFDEDKLDMGGYFAASGHTLEISFETHLLRIQGRSILFTERGRRHDDLQKFLKKAVKEMSPGERETFRAAWIERLITAAVASGAKIPPRKRKDAPDTDNETRPTKRATKAVVDDDVASSSTTLATLPSVPSGASTGTQVRQLIGNPKQRGLDSYGWKKAEPGEIQRYWSNASAAGSERHEEILKEKERTTEEKELRERDLARLRKQREHERKKREKGGQLEDTNNANLALMRGAQTASKEAQIPDVADLSRPLTQGWKKHRTGTSGGVVRGQSKKTFWFHPFLFVLIHAALIRHDWSPTKTVAYLQRTHPALFNSPGSRLNKGTLWRWLVPQQPRFTDAALLKISGRRSLTGSGRTGILVPYPEIVETITKTLKDLRTSGCVVNVPIARSVMIAIIRKERPELLDKFTCSEKFVRSFVDSKLSWTSRKGTRAAKHIPENATELCERTFFRLAYTIEHEHIPAKLIINYDQTGVYIRPNANQTFEVRGSKQVSVAGNDEKRAYTLGVPTKPDGTPLGLEQVWSGLSERSLPKATADGYSDAKKQLIQFINWPHVKAMIDADPDLDDDQKAIFYIDIYPVHISQAYRQFIFDEYPNIILVFVPGNLTGVFQPQDVGIQRVAKHHLRQSMLEHLVRCHESQVAAGITPENVTFTSSYPVLHDASVRACVDLYDWLASPEGREIIKRSWLKCEVPGKPQYNLSYDCLTSRDTRKALRKYLQEDKILADEIEERLGSVSLPSLAVGETDIEQLEDCGDLPDDDDRVGLHQPEDDSDVPLSEVVESAMGLVVAGQSRELSAKKVIEENPVEGLSTADAEEDVWAFNDEGRMWTSIEEIAAKSRPEEHGDSDEASTEEDDE
ncbi:DDE superfamily protein [Mycena venus]|uniref:DDE superfamily protein n=1 Tax=Mycena venus TaxID=2733690 RepID=A0A8H7DHN6_9AGAR|nr:DDE superfamily protein [Mycena venus]